MKNFKTFFTIIAIGAVFGLVLAGCKTDPDPGTGTPAGDPKKVVITGTGDNAALSPTGATGKVTVRIIANLDNVSPNQNQPVNTAVGIGSISSGSLSVDLYTIKTDTTSSPSTTKWTGKGDYYIYLVPEGFNNNNQLVYGSGNGLIYMGTGSTPLKYTIHEGTVTLAADTFKKYNTWKD